MRNVMFIGLWLTAALAFTQTGAEVPLLQTEHYVLYGDSTDSETIARQMELRFSLYNQVFRFISTEDTPADETAGTETVLPLKLRVFNEQEGYEAYVRTRLGDAPPGAVYLHYRHSDRRELVLCTGSDAAQKALRYQAFIQFLRAFVPNPPLWIREGFAAVFATLEFDEAGEPRYEENLTWLNTVQNTREKPSPQAIMRADAQLITDHFPGWAWSLVSFFLNSGAEDYTRSMTESFMLLSPDASAEENTAAVVSRISAWNNMETLSQDYYHYLETKKSFAVLVREGQAAYTEGLPGTASAAFREAMELRPGHYAPYYYLGLLAYDSGHNEAAETLYRAAIDYGADKAVVLYALGLNAAAAGKTNDALTFLQQSATAAPDRYGEKAGAVIARLQ